MLCFRTQIKVGTLCVKDDQVLRLEHILGLMEIRIKLMQNIEMNMHGFRFIEIETGFVAKPNQTAINQLPLPPLIYSPIGYSP